MKNPPYVAVLSSPQVLMKKIVKKILSLFLFCGIASQVHAYDIRTGILSYYPFNTTTTNDTAYTNNFMAINAPALITTNPAPRASVLGLTGPRFTNPQYLEFDHSPDNSINGQPLYKAGSYSVTMWVKGAAQTLRYLFTHGNSANQAPLFVLQTGNAAANNAKFDVIIRPDTGASLINHAVSSNVVFDNNWHHVAFVDNFGDVKLYVDGNLDGNSPLFNYTPAGTFTFDRTSVGTLIRTNVATNNIFNGAIDDLSLWERPLTQSEVQNIMTNGITTPVPPTLPAAVIIQPASVTKSFQDAATFSVAAAGALRPNNVLTYQWRSNGVPILDATNRTYRIFSLTTNDSGKLFSVAVSNLIGGEISSDAVLTVLPEAPPSVPTGVVSYWPFDSVTNNGGIYTTIDLYSRNDLRLTNMTETNVVVGQFSNALSFNNLETNAAFRTGGMSIYNTNTGYTVSLWVKADGTFQSDARVFAEGFTNVNGTFNANPLFTIGTANPVSPLGQARVFIRSDAGSILLDRLSTRTVFEAGGTTWHHLVWVDKNGQGKLYVDGALDETDFTYNPTPLLPLTLNTTSVGAIARGTNVSNGIFGSIDEVATWNRPLTYTEVQQVKNTSVPPPVSATPPSITTQPVGTNVFTGADLTFTVGVAGTAPFTNQWFKGSSPVLNATNFSLTLTNVQLTDAGSYSLVITNAGGRTNSQPAVLTVTARPAAPSSLGIDFNDRGSSAGDVEAGFESFTLDGTGATPVQTTRLFGGVEVTVNGSNGTTVDSRNRVSPPNTNEFTEMKLLQDFIFSPPTTGTEGLDVRVRFLATNQLYTATIWSFDVINAGARISDWYANGILVKDNYTFDGSIPPTNNLQYQFSFNVTSDAAGTILFQGRREATGTGVSVFLNALKIFIPPPVISNIEIVGGTIRLTVQTSDSSKQHTVEKTDNLSTISWSTVSGVTTTILSPTALRLEFPQPANGMQFYRINRAP